MYRTPKTIPSLRRELIGDSLERAKLVKDLIRLVREDERSKTIHELASARERVER